MKIAGHSAPPGPALPHKTSGPPSAPQSIYFTLDTDSFENCLRKSAEISFSLRKAGNGKYTASKSSMLPIVNYLKNHRRLDQNDIRNLRTQIANLKPKKAKKYRLALSKLLKRLHTIANILCGVDSAIAKKRCSEIARLAANGAAQGQDLLDSERSAITRYKTPSGYQDVNRGLRGLDRFNSESFRQAKEITRGLKKLHPVKRPVYRGSGCLIGGGKTAIPGKIYTEKAFLSVTQNYNTAFSSLFRICVYPKERFFDISDITEADDLNAANLSDIEQEALALPGTSFRYLGFREGMHVYEEV